MTTFTKTSFVTRALATIVLIAGLSAPAFDASAGPVSRNALRGAVAGGIFGLIVGGGRGAFVGAAVGAGTGAMVGHVRKQRRREDYYRSRARVHGSRRGRRQY